MAYSPYANKYKSRQAKERGGSGKMKKREASVGIVNAPRVQVESKKHVVQRVEPPQLHSKIEKEKKPSNTITVSELCSQRHDSEKFILEAEEKFYHKDQPEAWDDQKEGYKVNIDKFERSAMEAAKHRQAFQTIENILKEIIEADYVAEQRGLVDDLDQEKKDYPYFFLRRRMLREAQDLARDAKMHIDFDLVVTTDAGKALESGLDFKLEEIEDLFKKNFMSPVAGSVKRDYRDYPTWKVLRRGVIGMTRKEREYFSLLPYEVMPVKDRE